MAIILRNRFIFRLFMRSAFGNRKRVVLIVAGLMIGSAMISGALVMRSSMLTLSSNLVTLSYGHVDETITSYGNSLYGSYFNYSTYQSINSTAPDNSQVAGMVPMVYLTASAYDNTTRIPYNELGFVAAPWWANGILGNFVSVNGSRITSLPHGEMLIDELAAKQLGAAAGNVLTVYAGNGVNYTGVVCAIVKDNFRGYFDSGFNIFMRLSDAPAVDRAAGQISLIAVANHGSVLNAAQLSGQVMKALNSTLQSINSKQGTGLVAHPLLLDQLNLVHTEVGAISDLYLALSLFAVATGLILVAVIFYMLAEERMRDLGTLRALGLTRRQITGGFVSEGFIYTLLSCFSGAALGVGIGFVMTFGFIQLFGSTFAAPVKETGILLSSFTVTIPDVVTGFSAGAVATFAVILIASYRISRFSVIEAIKRNAAPGRKVTVARKILSPSALALVSLLMLYSGFYLKSLETAMLGISLISLSAVWFVIAVSGADFLAGIAGAALILMWGIPQSWNLFPQNFTHSYYIYVESGLFLVTGGILIFFSLEPLMLRLVRPGRNRSGRIVPTVRQALAFPAQKKIRTAASLALFSFVIFGIVSVSVLGSMIDQAAVQTVTKQSGGYNFVVYSGNGGNLTSAVTGNSTLSGYISTADLIYDTSTAFTLNSTGAKPFIYPIVGVPAGGADGGFAAQNRYQFHSYLPQFGSAHAVWSAVRNNSSLAIIDMTLAGITQGNFGTGVSAPVSVSLGSTLIAYGNNHASRSVVVAGILDEFGFQGVFVSLPVMSSLGVLKTSFPVLFVRLAPGVSPTVASINMRRALTPYNPVVINLNLITQQLTMDIQGIVEMTEIFIAMGLVAGTAGLGIIAMRSVVERNQQIGLLRALGFTRGMTSASFLLEFAFIAVSGSLIGVVMSLINGNVIATRLSSVLVFTYSPSSIILLVAFSLLLTIAAVAGSVRAVSRIEPSAAIRYIE